MKKQNILAFAQKSAMRMMKSVGIGSVLLSAAALIAIITPSAASARRPCQEPTATLLVAGLDTGLESAKGSTVGPDGALYVTEGAAGRISRVDPLTGEVTTFASGLPPSIINIGGAFVGGAIDVAFIDNIAYALVTLVSPDVGGSHVDGIYRVDGPESFTVLADIGEFNLANPPPTPFDVPTGLQFALQSYRGGFLVTDGHLNRVLRVTLDGEVSVLMQFDNIVPTGLEVRGNTVYMAEAGPVPHLPQNGKVVSFEPRSPSATEVASGAPLLVDVEFGPGNNLYALSQGIFPVGGDPGSPALPNTGALVRINGAGFTVITEPLDRPTSLEFIGNRAYVVTLTGEIWKINGVSCPPYGMWR
jgi:hypothetical protein